MFTDQRLIKIRDFLETVLIVLERRAVQRQIVAFVAILLVAWFASWLIERLLWIVSAERNGTGAGDSEQLSPALWRRRLKRWAHIAHNAVLPLLGLGLSELTLVWFGMHGWPAGLIEQLRPAFWLLLVYRIIVGIMEAALSHERARRYIRRFLAPLFVIIVMAIIGANLSGVFGLGDLELIQVLGATITLGSLVGAIIILYFFFVIAWIGRDLVTLLASRRTRYEPGAIHAVTMIGYYTVISIGVLTALAILGFNLSTLAIIGGGLSVGLGFGLQELVSNFISGILLLFEQSLRVGDVISVGGHSGKVDKLHMRATVLRTLDNEEIFVPNKDLLTSTVQTFTHSDRLVRRVVAVGVSYDADPMQIRDLLLQIADRHGKVLKHPPPQVHFANFGDSSLDFELLFWLDDPPIAANVQSDLRFMIWTEFTKHAIEIPFPQRDVHLRSGVAPATHPVQAA